MHFIAVWNFTFK